VTIPGFTSTGSKRPEALFGSTTGNPIQFVRADGCRVWDAEGREYLDLVMALGAVALGYGHPEVNAAAEQALREGVVGPLPHVSEQELAERLAAVIPGAESVRFLKTGAEAVAAAVRIARAVTGRVRVVSCGYHGWLDWCQEGPGVPGTVASLRREVPFNDSDALEAAIDEFGPVAAVVIEPVVESAPDPQWLSFVRELSDKTGAVLIFDEIKTAFRIAVGGAAAQYGVIPDLAVFGKALGNGFPISAVCGSRDLMSVTDRTWISSTLATEHLSSRVATAVLDVFEENDVVEILRQRGQQLLEGLEKIAMLLSDRGVSAKGVPQMCYLDFADSGMSAEFASRAAGKGVIFKRNAYNFVSYAHTAEVLDDVVTRLEAVAKEVRQTC